MKRHDHVEEDSEAGHHPSPPTQSESQPRFSSASQVPHPLPAKHVFFLWQQSGHCLALLVTSSLPPAFAKPDTCPTPDVGNEAAIPWNNLNSWHPGKASIS